MDLGAMLAGKRVLITGASSGLGENFARLCARCRAHVVIGARRRERLDALAPELLRLGAPGVRVLTLDVASEASIDAAFAELDAAGEALDVVVNNAGISRGALALDMSTTDFDDQMAINVRGVWLVSVRAARRWKAAGRGGAIVNIASVAGIAGAPKLGVYAAAKHGVVGLTRSAAVECATKGVRINAVCPSFARTAMVTGILGSDNPAGEAELTRGVPMRRLAETDEIAEVVLFAADPKNSFMTGQTLAADGGITAI